MGDQVDPVEVLAAWPDDDAVRQAPELAVEQIHDLAAEVEVLQRQIKTTGAVHEQWYGRAQKAERYVAAVEEWLHAADRCSGAGTWVAAAADLRQQIATGPHLTQGSRANPSPAPAAARDTAVPGVEVGTVVVLDLEGVRNGHVPWPGDADDGTCSCCGMPHPCVTRRLADELDTARAEIESWKRCARTWKPGNRALIAQAGWAEARADKAEAQVAAAWDEGHAAGVEYGCRGQRTGEWLPDPVNPHRAALDGAVPPPAEPPYYAGESETPPAAPAADPCDDTCVLRDAGINTMACPDTCEREMAIRRGAWPPPAAPVPDLMGALLQSVREAKARRAPAAPTHEFVPLPSNYWKHASGPARCGADDPINAGDYCKRTASDPVHGDPT